MYIYWGKFSAKAIFENFFIFAALLFSENILNLPLLLKTICAFVVFCFLSGSVYLINDLVDMKQDRLHPTKSLRPLASGKLHVSYAIVTLLLFIPLSLVIALYLKPLFFVATLVYLLIQLAYSFFLKQEIILDVFAIAFGFVLRVIAGAVVISVDISPWFLICAFLLSIFLALSKRRHELLFLSEQARSHRKVLRRYDPYLLDQMIAVVTASTIMSYILYTVSEETVKKFGTTNLLYTVPFVLFGIFRYLYLVHKKNKGGSPEIALLTDKSLMISIFLWSITVVIILYL